MILGVGLIHIPIKLYEDILNGYCIMAVQECLEKNQSKGHNSETMREETIIFVCDMFS